MAVDSAAFLRLVGTLAEVEQAQNDKYTSFAVGGRKFGYHWPRTRTAGLKQTLTEQLALIAERPDVFEEQFTWGGFGWVVVQLDLIDPEELAELLYESWRLTAPPDLVQQSPDWATTPPQLRPTP
ncbi:MmcQ/YjbR family DNA-binding protein [Actinokineospora sp. G85]|uniref:MmcQ/YjbR family DNA-binding protein n=1 Tax=Actinokineospora sp. G85 TaxID=3406626 RepID=UPI003C748020